MGPLIAAEALGGLVTQGAISLAVNARHASPAI